MSNSINQDVVDDESKSKSKAKPAGGAGKAKAKTKTKNNNKNKIQKDGIPSSVPSGGANNENGKKKRNKKKKINQKNRPKKCRFGDACRGKGSCRFLHPDGSVGVAAERPPRRKGDALDRGVYFGAINEPEASGYRAAGVIVIRQTPSVSGPFEIANPAKDCGGGGGGGGGGDGDGDEDDVDDVTETKSGTDCKKGHQILMCVERRESSMRLNFLGGKIEHADKKDARVTAAREFWEETGQFFSIDECMQLVSPNAGDDGSCALPIWCGPGKYVMYAKYVQGECFDQLPQLYQHANAKGELRLGAEAEYLVWVDWALLSDPRTRKRNFKAVFSAPDRTSRGTRRSAKAAATKLEAVPISRFLGSMLSQPKFVAAIDSVIATRDTIAMENDDTNTESVEAISAALHTIDLK